MFLHQCVLLWETEKKNVTTAVSLKFTVGFIMQKWHCTVLDYQQ